MFLLSLFLILKSTFFHFFVRGARVELSGSGSKEGIARVIGWQYAVAPVLLSLSVTATVGMAMFLNET